MLGKAESPARHRLEGAALLACYTLYGFLQEKIMTRLYSQLRPRQCCTLD
jgi:hypothetical protein